MINRVEPKIVELIKRVPGVTIQNVAGKGHYVFIAHCNTAPFDNNDLRLALKYAIDREEMVQTDPAWATARSATTRRSTSPIRCSPKMEQRTYDPDKAAFHYKKSGHSGSDPAAHLRRRLPGRRRCGPALPAERCQGRHHASKSSASPATATGRKSGTSSPSRPPTGAVARRRTRCIPPPTIPRPTGTTRASSTRSSTRCCLRPAPNSTTDKRKQIYADMGTIVRDEGGVIAADVQRLHRCDRPQGRRLGRRRQLRK